MELTDRVGILHDVLRYFWKHDVNICRIESRPAKHLKPTEAPCFDFFVDLHGGHNDPNIQMLLAELRPLTNNLLILDEKEVRGQVFFGSDLITFSHLLSISLYRRCTGFRAIFQSWI